MYIFKYFSSKKKHFLQQSTIKAHQPDHPHRAGDNPLAAGYSGTTKFCVRISVPRHCKPFFNPSDYGNDDAKRIRGTDSGMLSCLMRAKRRERETRYRSLWKMGRENDSRMLAAVLRNPDLPRNEIPYALRTGFHFVCCYSESSTRAKVWKFRLIFIVPFSMEINFEPKSPSLRGIR